MEERNFISYDYQERTIDKKLRSMYEDAYRNFGWQQVGTSPEQFTTDKITLHFKRNRKIKNKAELTRLQRNFDVCLKEIQRIERSKAAKAFSSAFGVGFIGTTFMALSVFAVTADKVVLCIILSIPGFIGWALPYFLYKAMYQKRSTEVSDLIEDKYDELYNVCERASTLL